jgi:hypothetical protein
MQEVLRMLKGGTWEDIQAARLKSDNLLTGLCAAAGVLLVVGIFKD